MTTDNTQSSVNGQIEAIPCGAAVLNIEGCKRKFIPVRENHKFCSPSCKYGYHETARKMGERMLMKRSGMHAPRVSGSPTLQLTLGTLLDGKWHTTKEIQDRTRSTAPSTDISALRKNGYTVESRYRGRTETGRKVYEYRLED